MSAKLLTVLPSHIFGIFLFYCFIEAACTKTVREFILSRGFLSDCNANITLTDNVMLRSHATAGLLNGLTKYLANEDCTVTVETDEGKTIMSQFTYLDLQGRIANNCVDFIEISERGNSTNESLWAYIQLTTVNTTSVNTTELCENISYVSLSNKLEIRFVTDSTIQKTGFVLLLTSIRVGLCTDKEFNCDHNRCIPSTLKCDGTFHCADRTDESQKWAKCWLLEGIGRYTAGLGQYSVLAITALATGFVFSVFIIIILLECCRKRTGKKNNKEDDNCDTSGPDYSKTVNLNPKVGNIKVRSNLELTKSEFRRSRFTATNVALRNVNITSSMTLAKLETDGLRRDSQNIVVANVEPKRSSVLSKPEYIGARRPSQNIVVSNVKQKFSVTPAVPESKRMRDSTKNMTVRDRDLKHKSNLNLSKSDSRGLRRSARNFVVRDVKSKGSATLSKSRSRRARRSAKGIAAKGIAAKEMIPKRSSTLSKSDSRGVARILKNKVGSDVKR